MRITYAKVKAQFPDAKIYTAAIYVTPNTVPMVDFVACELDCPHVLEWNWFSSGFTRKAAFDFDGIFCADCSPEDDDDGPRYAAFLANARPNYLARREPVQCIVTARLEKYRPQTVEWMERHGMSCNRLIMGPWKSQQDRAGNIAAWKSAVFSCLPYAYFVESHPQQAVAITEATGRPVLCPAAGRILWPSSRYHQSQQPC